MHVAVLEGLSMLAAGWEFARPGALWALCAALPLVALHLYLARRRRWVVASLRFVEEALARAPASARFQRMRDRLALLARLLALAALVAALAGLAPRDVRPPAQPTLVLFDADRTTSAREAGGEIRYARALRALRAEVAALPRQQGQFDAPLALVRAGGVFETLLPFTRDVAAAERALATWPDAPSSAAVALAPALAEAARSLEATGGGRLVVLTARRVPAADEVSPVGSGVVERIVRGVGSARDDQAIVDLRVVRRPDGLAYDIAVDVANHASDERTRTLRARLETLSVAERSIVLRAGETQTIEWVVPAPSVPSLLVVEWFGEDAWPANDELRAGLAPAFRPRVLVAHNGGVRPFTQAALAALGDEIDADRSGVAAAVDLGRTPPYDVVVVDGASVPADAPREGAMLLLGPLGGRLPFALGRSLVEPLVWRVAEGHPLVADIDLSTAFAIRGQAIVGEGFVTLADAEGEAVLVEGRRDALSYIALGLDPDGSALPLAAAWPLLVRNAVRRLAVAPQRPFPPIVDAGGEIELPAGEASSSMFSPATGFVRDRFLAPPAHALLAANPTLDGGRRRVDVEAAGSFVATWAGAAPGGAARVQPIGIRPYDPARSIVPAQVEGVSPPPAQPRADVALQWRRRWIALGGFLLLLDLLLLRSTRPRLGRFLTGVGVPA